MHIRVIAMLDLPASRAFAARPIGRIRRQAQESSGKIHGKRGFAHAFRPYEQECVGRFATLYGALDKSLSGGMPARHELAHDYLRLASGVVRGELSPPRQRAPT